MLFVVLVGLCLGELVAVVEICRHGGRSPVRFVEEWDSLEVWPEGPGELLGSGMRQQFLLGSVMRKNYLGAGKLLSGVYNESEIFVFSSDFNRTIMSAQSQVQGLFPAGTGERVSEKASRGSVLPPISVKDVERISDDLGAKALPYGTQLVPIHSDSTIRQYALSSSRACPYYGSLISYKKQMSSEKEKIFDQYSDVIKTIQLELNYTEEEAQSQVSDIIDSLISHNFAFGKLPLGFNSTFFTRGQRLQDRLKSFFDFEPDLLARFAGTALLSLVVSDLSLAQKTGKKFFLYSAHDTTLSCALAFLEQDYSVQPPFASSLIFELHKEEKGLFLEVKYNGKKLKVAGDLEKFSFERFQEYVGERSIRDLVQRCKEVPSDEVLQGLEEEYVGLSEVKTQRNVLSGTFIAGVLVFASILTAVYSKFGRKSMLEEHLIPINPI